MLPLGLSFLVLIQQAVELIMNCHVEWTGPDDPKEDPVEPKLVDVLHSEW